MILPVISIEKLILLSMFILIGSGWLAWQSSKAASKLLRVGITTLRIIGFALVLVIAFNPGNRQSKKDTETTTWALLLDGSRSMEQQDAENGQSRLTFGRKVAREALAISAMPDQVRAGLFADRLYSVNDGFADVHTVEGDTDLVGCGRAILNEFAGTGLLRGLLVLSDGRQVNNGQLEELAIRAQAQNTPLYAVAIGGMVARSDIQVRSIRRQYVAFKGQDVRVDVELTVSGMGGVRVPVSFLDQDRNAIAEMQVTVEGNDVDETASGTSAVQSRRLTFEVDALPPGRHNCSVSVPALEEEQTVWNNSDTFEIVILENPVATLHVEGLPYWDSKFLLQLLRQQPNLSVESIYRVGDGRFFKVESKMEDSQPVDGTVFPESKESIAKYDMVILGKGCEYFLTPARVQALRAFVRDQGGALVFSRGKPYHGTFPDLATLEAGEWGPSTTSALTLHPTVTGEDLGLFGRLLPGVEDPIWSEIPPIRHANTISRLHSFTRVLAVGQYGRSSDQDVPLILGRRYGKGMIVTVNADGMWQWDFMPSDQDVEGLYRDMWSQLLNWTVTYGEFLPGEDYVLRVDQTMLPAGGRTHVFVQHRPVDGEVVTPVLRIKQGDVNMGTVPLVADPDDPLRWDGIVALSDAGDYRLCLEVGGVTGLEQSISVLPQPDEYTDQSADIASLSQLCLSTGGRIIDANEVADVVRDFEKVDQRENEVESVWNPLWDSPYFLLLMCLPFALEWFLRRRHGLL